MKIGNTDLVGERERVSTFWQGVKRSQVKEKLSKQLKERSFSFNP